MFGCTKNESHDIKSLSITLRPVRQSNDTLVLEWNAVASLFLKSYVIIKSGLGGWMPIMSATPGSVTRFYDTDKSIEVFSMTTYQHIRSINTTCYPYKIFKSDNKIICIGTYHKRDHNYQIPDNLFIEFI